MLTTNGSGVLSWSADSVGIASLVADTTPQLGGSLDVNGQIITSTSNGDVVIDPAGTGAIKLKSDSIIFEGAGTVTVPSLKLTEFTALGTDYVGFKPPIIVTTSVLWELPAADGTANQALSTNGSGVLSFNDIVSKVNPVTQGALSITHVASLQGKIILKDADSSHGVTLITPAVLSADYTLTLPANDGDANQVLTTDGSGVLSFAAAAAGVTVGNQGDNRIVTATASADALTSESNLTYDGSKLDVTGGVEADAIHTGMQGLTAAGDFGHGAELVFGYTTTVAAGKGVYLRSNGAWAGTDSGTLGAWSKGFIAVATSNAATTGLLTRGFVYVHTDPGGSLGDVVYLSTGGLFSTTPVTGTTGMVSRVVGYKVATNIIFFDPSKDWIVIS